jgi:hypothetical protein
LQVSETTSVSEDVVAPPIPLAQTTKQRYDELKTKNTRPSKNPRGKGVGLISDALSGINSARESSTVIMMQFMKQSQDQMYMMQQQQMQLQQQMLLIFGSMHLFDF